MRLQVSPPSCSLLLSAVFCVCVGMCARASIFRERKARRGALEKRARGARLGSTDLLVSLVGLAQWWVFVLQLYRIVTGIKSQLG